MLKTTMMLTHFFLALSFLAPAVVGQPVIPVIHSNIECSRVLDGGASVVITNSLKLHWRLQDENEFAAVVEYQEQGWVGLGFSNSGDMVHSKAVIGQENGVALYDLSLATLEGVIPVENDDAQVRGSLLEDRGMSQLVFTMKMLPDLFKEVDGLYTLIIAAGESNTLGYHRHRFAFRINLRHNACDPDSTEEGTTSGTAQQETQQTTETIYDHKAAFAAHGLFATLSFAMFIPLAVFASHFRTLLPRWWIYIHVLCNTVAFLFTLITVILAFSAMAMRGKTVESHMSQAHHWTGIFLLIVVVFQVLLGFRRPPVDNPGETKFSQVYPTSDKSESCLPTTRREKWYFMHRVAALVTIAGSLFQLHSGFTLFSEQYSNGSKTTLIIYWLWTALLLVFFVGTKYTMVAKDNHRRSSSPRNIMPQRSEDDTDTNLITLTNSFDSGHQGMISII
jgi:hypothetical protein